MTNLIDKVDIRTWIIKYDVSNTKFKSFENNLKKLNTKKGSTRKTGLFWYWFAVFSNMELKFSNIAK